MTLDYSPGPAEVVVPGAAEDEALARVLVTVLAAERRDGDKNGPFELRLRLRLESLGEQPLAIAAADLLLVDADLRPFGPARLLAGPPTAPDAWPPAGAEAPAEVRVPASGATLVDAFFPFPAGVTPYSANLEGLNLRWRLQVGERRLLLGTTFSRVLRPQVYYLHDPWPYHYYGHPYRYGGWTYQFGAGATISG